MHDFPLICWANAPSQHTRNEVFCELLIQYKSICVAQLTKEAVDDQSHAHYHRHYACLLKGKKRIESNA